MTGVPEYIYDPRTSEKTLVTLELVRDLIAYLEGQLMATAISPDKFKAGKQSYEIGWQRKYLENLLRRYEGWEVILSGGDSGLRQSKRIVAV